MHRFSYFFLIKVLRDFADILENGVEPKQESKSP